MHVLYGTDQLKLAKLAALIMEPKEVEVHTQDQLADHHRAKTGRPTETAHSRGLRRASTSLPLDLGEKSEYLDKPTQKDLRYKSNLHNTLAKGNQALLI